MKNNENGLSLVEILVVIVIVGLVAAVGWLVYDRQKTKPSGTDSGQKQAAADSSQLKSTQNDKAVSKKVDTTIHEVNITLQAEADLAKLPTYTPQSFKDYMTTKLRSNKAYDNGEAIVTPQWSISKISQVNITGGQAPVDKNGQGYPGGAPAIWVLTPSGTWDEETLNGPVCLSKNGGKVYEEFVKTCFDNAHPDGVKNPNGSIGSLNL